MLSTVGSNFVRDMNSRKIMESQDEVRRKDSENSGSTLRKFSDDDYLNRKLRLKVNSVIKTNELFKTSNDHAMQGFSLMHDRIESIRDTLSDFSEVLNAFKISDDDDPGIREQVSVMLKRVINDLNAEWNGRYLFSGEMVNTKPVDEDFVNTDTSMTFDLYNGDLDYSYYSGGLDKVKLQLTKSLETSYDINAGDVSFAIILNSMNAFVNKQIDKESVDVLKTALDDVGSALQSILSKVDAVNHSLNEASNALEEESKSMSDLIQDNRNFDMMKMYSALVEMSRNLGASLEMNKMIDKSRWGNSN